MADPIADSNQTSTTFQTFSGSTFSPPAALTSGSGAYLTEVLAETSANDLASTANYVYSFIALLGFGAGCFIFYSFIQTYRAQRRLAWLDCLLWVFCGVQLLLLLLSLHMVAHRPRYMQSTALGCAALSFAANVASLCGLLILVLMAFVLTLDPPSSAPLRNPRVCAALVVLTSVLVSLLLAGLRGLQAGGDCVVDPYQDGVSYAAAKLSLAFLAPYILLAGLLISGCIRQWRSEGRFLSGSEEGPVFLTVTVCMFLCQLFYSVALVRGALLVQSRMEKAFLTVAECVLFSGSSLGLLAVLLLHRPSRESLQGAARQLRDCCRQPGRAQPSRNIIAPHIEITDTLQDIES